MVKLSASWLNTSAHSGSKCRADVFISPQPAQNPSFNLMEPEGSPIVANQRFPATSSSTFLHVTHLLSGGCWSQAGTVLFSASGMLSLLTGNFSHFSFCSLSQSLPTNPAGSFPSGRSYLIFQCKVHDIENKADGTVANCPLAPSSALGHRGGREKHKECARNVKPKSARMVSTAVIVIHLTR